MYLKIVLLQTLRLICKAPGHHIMSSFIQTIRPICSDSTPPTACFLQNQLGYSWLPACPPWWVFSWHPKLLNMVAFRKTSFPWHTGRRADACLSTQHIISMRCISTVMNASLPLGSVLVPPRTRAPVCGSSYCCVWSTRERSTRQRWQGARRSNKWQNLRCAVIQCVRSSRAGTAPNLPSASFTCAFPSCQFAHNVTCLPSSFACQRRVARVPAPAAIRALRGPGGSLPGPLRCHTHKDHEIRQEKI